MKWYISTAAIAVLCLGLFCSFPTMNNQVQAASTEQLTVLNPMGTPPPIQAKEMAPRLDTLDGKTIYFVNTGYIGTDRLMDVMIDWFKENYPNTKIAMGRGGMTNIPQNVRDEIAENGDAAIIGLGH
jgi:hypothetical protein